MADCAGLGAIEIKAMRERGYKPDFAAAITVASSVIGPLIPPSIVMIVFGVTANVSISDLFLGGTGPGLLLASIYMLYIYSRARMNPALAPALPEKEGPSGPRKRAAIKALIAPLFVITSVMGTIYSGIASVTEAAASRPVSSKAAMQSGFRSKPDTLNCLSSNSLAILPPMGPSPMMPTVMVMRFSSLGYGYST